MELTSKLLVTLYFSITLIAIIRVGFIDQPMMYALMDVTGLIGMYMILYYIAKSMPSRLTVETATYVFSTLRNKSAITNFYMPKCVELNKDSESQRIYRFVW